MRRMVLVLWCVVGYGSAARFKGPEDRIWDAEQCSDLGSTSGVSTPRECMLHCKNRVGCTAVNYNNDGSICVLRACALPVPKPTRKETSFVGYSLVSYSSPMCSDRLDSCAKRVADGECDNNISYMSDHCMASCIMFSTTERTCSDNNSNCGTLAARGDCDATPEYMNFNCPETCNLCDPRFKMAAPAIKKTCPNGFIGRRGNPGPHGTPGPLRCFVVFKDTERNWEEARRKCTAEGLSMAASTGEDAIIIRKNILDRHGHSTSVWLEARGDGSNLVWQNNRNELRNDSPLWQPDEPAGYITTGDCLYMDVGESSFRQYPDRPYASYNCSSRENLYTLCEI